MDATGRPVGRQDIRPFISPAAIDFAELASLDRQFREIVRTLPKREWLRGETFYPAKVSAGFTTGRGPHSERVGSDESAGPLQSATSTVIKPRNCGSPRMATGTPFVSRIEAMRALADVPLSGEEPKGVWSFARPASDGPARRSWWKTVCLCPGAHETRTLPRPCVKRPNPYDGSSGNRMIFSHHGTTADVFSGLPGKSN